MVIGQGIIHPMIYGPLAGLYSELFDTEHRYTGASLGYQIAGIGAGISPVLFAAILNSTGSPSTIPLSIVHPHRRRHQHPLHLAPRRDEITDPVRTELRRDSSCHRHRIGDRHPTSSHGRTDSLTFTHPSLARLSERQAIDYGEKTAITFAGIDYSYVQMHERTLARAADLHCTWHSPR